MQVVSACDKFDFMRRLRTTFIALYMNLMADLLLATVQILSCGHVCSAQIIKPLYHL